MRSAIFKATSLLLLLAFPVTTLAADPAGMMLYPQGQVLVNGAPISRSQAGFAGDRYQTSKDSALVMSGFGSSVQVAPSSDISFLASGVRLNAGNTMISTSGSFGASVVNLTIKPVNPSARYQIQQSATQVIIAAHEGALRISDGVMERLVEPGMALVADLEPQAPTQTTSDDDFDKKCHRRGCKVTTEQDENGRPKKRCDCGGAIPAAETGVSLSKAKAVLIWTLVATGAILLAFCLVEWCVSNNKPVSPAR
jgi:hypothetical protein